MTGKILVVGCGSIGERHIRNLKSLSSGEIIACDISEERLKNIESKYNVKTYLNLEEAFEQPLLASFICTPTSLHMPIALLAASVNSHIFIEKPLSHTMSGVDELIGALKGKKLVTLVGCNTRFLPSMKLVKGLLEKGAIGKVLSARSSCGFYLPYWHPEEDYKKGYTANSSLGGGIILDDIHEIDYLRWLLKEEVKEVFCFSGKISDLEMDTEDYAAILLKFRSGVVAEVHYDCLQQVYRRSCELIGEKGIILWDYIADTVQLLTEENRDWQIFSGIFSEEIKVDRNQMFLDEIKHFFSCIEGRENSQNDIIEARQILRIALAAKESSQKKKIIAVY